LAKGTRRFTEDFSLALSSPLRSQHGSEVAPQPGAEQSADERKYAVEAKRQRLEQERVPPPTESEIAPHLFEQTRLVPNPRRDEHQAGDRSRRAVDEIR